MSETIARHRQRAALMRTCGNAVRGLKIQGLLLFLGMPKSRVPARYRTRRLRGTLAYRNFWTERAHELPELLEETRECWKERMKEQHPDINPKGHEQTVLLILAWRRVQKMFAAHAA